MCHFNCHAEAAVVVSWCNHHQLPVEQKKGNFLVLPQKKSARSAPPRSGAAARGARGAAAAGPLKACRRHTMRIFPARRRRPRAVPRPRPDGRGTAGSGSERKIAPRPPYPPYIWQMGAAGGVCGAVTARTSPIFRRLRRRASGRRASGRRGHEHPRRSAWRERDATPAAKFRQGRLRHAPPRAVMPSARAIAAAARRSVAKIFAASGGAPQAGEA